MESTASGGTSFAADAVHVGAPGGRARTGWTALRSPPATSAAGAEHFARLDALADHRHVLLLQGPNGPFFSRLARRLRARGACVTKVNLNAADQWFYKEPRAMAYTGTLANWPRFLTELIRSENTDAIVLFGQSRPYHRIARKVGARAGLKVYVFEEGYARPWWITMEEGGVNELSILATVDTDQLPRYPRVPRPTSFHDAFARMAIYSAGYFAAGMVGQRKYPHYVHHKPFQASEAKRWTLAFMRKIAFRVTERRAITQFLDPYSPDYFLVPLQLGNDSQIVHCSPWRSNERFIESVIESFARHAEADDLLIFKHHPLECGHADYASTITQTARRYAVVERVKYIHGGHLPSLLKRSRGVVLVNSTTGIQAMFHGVPVCATGTAFYARPHLTSPNDMDAFWRDPVPPDRKHFTTFYRFMMHTTQINASFYASSDLSGQRPFRARSLLVRLAISYVAYALFDSRANFF